MNIVECISDSKNETQVVLHLTFKGELQEDKVVKRLERIIGKKAAYYHIKEIKHLGPLEEVPF